MLRFSLATLAVFAVTAGARADRMAPYASPAERALRAPVVVLGEVTSIEKETVDAPLYPGSTQKVAHKIAVVKVTSNLVGADNVTHLKVGFVLPAAEKGAGIRPGRGPNNPELKEGQEWLLFLTKNADGGFHAIPYMTPPLETNGLGFKDQLASVKKMLAAVADPARALKAEKAEDRFEAAVAIIYKLRTIPVGISGEVETVSLPVEESQRILKALGEGTWEIVPASQSFGGYSARAMLGIGPDDGWKAPAAVPGEDFAETNRKAFVKWLDGPGKNYRIKKLVVKKAEK